MVNLSKVIQVIVITLVLVVGSQCTTRVNAVDCWDVPGTVVYHSTPTDPIARPESIQFDSASGFWYNSNIGSPTVFTDGYISKRNPDGSIHTALWVAGLGNPAGVRVHKGTLYVADAFYTVPPAASIAAIIAIDIASGTIVKTYTLSPTLMDGGGTINDVEVDKKTNAIYVSVRAGTPTPNTTVLEVPVDGDGSDASRLVPPGSFGPQPNGVLLYKKDLIVVNSAGEFRRVDLETETMTTPLGATSLCAFPQCSLDGVEREGSSFLFTRNSPTLPTFLGRIEFNKDGTVKSEEKLCDFAPLHGAADLGINLDTRVVAIPNLVSHKITFINLDSF
jgi:hypothetical protein